MPRDSDAILIESVGIHRARLRQALLLGRLEDRRTVNDNVKRFIGSIVLAAVVGVGCLGYSFVMSVTSSSAQSATTPSPASSPAPSPASEK